MMTQVISQRLFRGYVLGFAVVGLGVLPAANAADLDPLKVLTTAPVTQPVEIGNGWYLRGDLGASIETNTGKGSFRTFNGGTYADGVVGYHGLRDNLNVGLGVGYQLNDILRLDGTLDFFNGSSKVSGTSPQPCVGASANTSCSYSGSGSFANYSAMLNGYVDLATIAGFTPYVGAGFGATRVEWGDYQNIGTCVDGTTTCTTSDNQTTTHGGQNSWRFTYAFMGGVSYNLSENTKFDLGYRYSKINGGKSYKFDSTSATAGATGSQGYDGGFERHEVRAGLRWSLW